MPTEDSVWVVLSHSVYDHGVWFVGTEAQCDAFCAAYAADDDAYHEWTVTEMRLGELHPDRVYVPKNESWPRALPKFGGGTYQREVQPPSKVPWP